MARKACQFVRKMSPYNVGEIAGFEGKELDGLLGRGIVSLVSEPSDAEPSAAAEPESDVSVADPPPEPAEQESLDPLAEASNETPSATKEFEPTNAGEDSWQSAYGVLLEVF